ncbi:hypothetical protein [Streptomyces herbicida]|uniref:hypothetical protein n=1 Tax=Streptomyces herbicida TaxID=3065675 RepID=UPI00292DA223|nr:hypothetical protein [Streptomyces sp. NEAU-HV9]
MLPLASAIATAGDLPNALTQAAAAYDGGLAAGLLLLAAAERAPTDHETAELVTEGLTALDLAIRQVLGLDGTPQALAYALTAAVLGLPLRSRAGAEPTVGAEAVQALQIRHWAARTCTRTTRRGHAALTGDGPCAAEARSSHGAVGRREAWRALRTAGSVGSLRMLRREP